MKKNKNWIFWVLITASILFCCWSFRFTSGERANHSAIGGEVFTIALPLWLIQKKMETMARANRQLRQRLKSQARSLARLQPIADAFNVAENPTR